MTNEDYAWAAGFFEGEGCLHLNIAHRSYGMYTYLTLDVSNTDLEVLDRFRNIVDCGTVRSEKSGIKHFGKKQMYRFSVSSRKDVAKILGFIEPWLSTRRKERLMQIRNQTSKVYRKRIPAEKCKYGHALIGNNRKPNGKGKITCRICVNMRNKRYWREDKLPEGCVLK